MGEFYKINTKVDELIFRVIDEIIKLDDSIFMERVVKIDNDKLLNEILILLLVK